jgi:hypothetical protein
VTGQKGFSALGVGRQRKIPPLLFFFSLDNTPQKWDTNSPMTKKNKKKSANPPAEPTTKADIYEAIRYNYFDNAEPECFKQKHALKFLTKVAMHNLSKINNIKS